MTNQELEQGIASSLAAELGAKYHTRLRLGRNELDYFVECDDAAFGIHLRPDGLVLLYRQGGVGVPPDTCLVDLADPHLFEKLANFVRDQPQK